jgi:hypothetical protein
VVAVPEGQLRDISCEGHANDDATEIRLLRESPVVVAPDRPLIAQVDIAADAGDQFLLNSRTGGKIEKSVPVNLEVVVESINQRPRKIPLRELAAVVADLPGVRRTNLFISV